MVKADGPVQTDGSDGYGNVAVDQLPAEQQLERMRGCVPGMKSAGVDGFQGIAS